MSPTLREARAGKRHMCSDPARSLAPGHERFQLLRGLREHTRWSERSAAGALPPGARCRPKVRLNHAQELLPILRLNAADRCSDWIGKPLNLRSQCAPKNLAEYESDFRYSGSTMAARNKQRRQSRTHRHRKHVQVTLTSVLAVGISAK